MEGELVMSASGPVSAEMALGAASIIDGVSTQDTPDEALATKAVVEGDRTTSFAVTIDEMTVARARKGNLAALETLFHTFEIPVYNLARRLCRSSHDAEDVLQETFLEVVRSVGRFRGEGSFAGWVRRITVTKALMKLRSLRAQGAQDELNEELAVEGSFGSGGLAAAMARIDLDVVLGRLPDSGRVVLWLHEVEGYNHDEIAALMGKTPSFSKSQLSRAYGRLRDWLGVQGRQA